MSVERPISDWIPMSFKEAEKRGWDEFDVILIAPVGHFRLVVGIIPDLKFRK